MSFDWIDAESACYTLGYTSAGSFTKIGMLDRWTENDIPFLMDYVDCGSASTNFLSCTSSPEECGHDNNVLLTCSDQSKITLVYVIIVSK